MRAPAIVLAIPLAIGSAFGLTVGEHAPTAFAVWAAAAALLALLGSLSAIMVGDDGRMECTVCVVAGALVVGVSLGADAARRAYRSPLLLWFEATRPGSSPVVLHGVLRGDAALTESGVSLSVDVRAVEPCAHPLRDPCGDEERARHAAASGCL